MKTGLFSTVRRTRWVAGLALATGTLVACGEMTEAETAAVQQESVGEVQAAVTSVAAEPPSADLLGDTSRVFPEGRLVVNGDADFVDLADADANMLIQQDSSEVYVTFVSSTAQNNNTLAFFTYQEGSTPTTAPTLTTVFSSTSGLSSGTRVSLGIFNGSTRIGFAILSSGKPTYYSVPGLNPDGAHFKAKFHKADNRRITGAEDQALSTSDKDYNDVLFSVQVTPYEVQPPINPKTPFTVYNPDLDQSLDGNYRGLAPVNCDYLNGEFLVGLGYKDVPGYDELDAVIIQCQSRLTGAKRWVTHSDAWNNSSTNIVSACAAGTVFRGVSYKEVPVQGSDFMDGVTSFCAPATNPASEPNTNGAPRALGDLTSWRPYKTFACSANSTPVGIAYKDTPVEWGNGNTDMADGITVVCQPN